MATRKNRYLPQLRTLFFFILALEALSGGPASAQNASPIWEIGERNPLLGPTRERWNAQVSLEYETYFWRAEQFHEYRKVLARERNGDAWVHLLDQVEEWRAVLEQWSGDKLWEAAQVRLKTATFQNQGAFIARRLISLAADKGHPDARFEEAKEFWGQDGYAGQSAFADMELLAYEGHVPALLELVRVYEQGDGIAKDAARAYFWSRRLMERIAQDHSTIDKTLSQQDRGKAEAWLADGLPYPPTVKGSVPDIEFDTRKALEQAARGDALNIMKILDMYHSGNLLPQDLAKAYYWHMRLEEMHLSLDYRKKDILSKITEEQLRQTELWLSDGTAPPR